MNHYGPGSPNVENLKILAGRFTRSRVEGRLRKPPRLNKTVSILAFLTGWNLEEPSPRELAQAFYQAVVMLSSHGRLVEYGSAFADVLGAFRSNGRIGPSAELRDMVHRAALASVGADLPRVDVDKLMVKWVRIVGLPSSHW